MIGKKEMIENVDTILEMLPKVGVLLNIVHNLRTRYPAHKEMLKTAHDSIDGLIGDIDNLLSSYDKNYTSKGETKMSNKLQVIKSEKFGEITADIYSDSIEMYMTAQQLGECLEYGDPIRGINKLVSRHEYLKESKFSVVVSLTTTDGKAYDTRVFNEDGIYEIAFLSNTDKAFEFREWVRGILKALRKGEAKIINTDSNFDKREAHIRLQRAKLLNRIADNYKGESKTYADILRAYDVEEITGKKMLPLQETNGRETYTAKEIGERFGISANKVGRIANSYNLKVDEYGAVYHDKSPHSSHEVDSFRYYDTVIPVIAEILKKEVS